MEHNRATERISSEETSLKGINYLVVFSDRLQPLFKLIFLQPEVNKLAISFFAVCFALWFRNMWRAAQNLPALSQIT